MWSWQCYALGDWDIEGRAHKHTLGIGSWCLQPSLTCWMCQLFLFLWSNAREASTWGSKELLWLSVLGDTVHRGGGQHGSGSMRQLTILHQHSRSRVHRAQLAPFLRFLFPFGWRHPQSRCIFPLQLKAHRHTQRGASYITAGLVRVHTLHLSQ